MTRRFHEILTMPSTSAESKKGKIIKHKLQIGNQTDTEGTVRLCPQIVQANHVGPGGATCSLWLTDQLITLTNKINYKGSTT